jgi:hypothetical protein
MRVSDFKIAEHVVVEGKVGWLHLNRKDKPTLVTRRENVALRPDQEARRALTADEATKIVKKLISAKQPVPVTTAEDLTRADELALALKLSSRMLQLVVARRDADLEAPESPYSLTDHEYMGTYTVGDELIVADRCYLDRPAPPLALRTPARPGTWHAFIRHATGFSDISVGIAVVHDDFPDDLEHNGDELGAFGVDSGSAVIADVRAASNMALWGDGERARVEGVVHDEACFAFTADGDGVFSARVLTRQGRATMVRASLAGDAEALIRPLIAAPADPNIDPYSSKRTYQAGDRIRHPAFGDGTVKNVLADRKVTVAFAEGPRAVLHAR